MAETHLWQFTAMLVLTMWWTKSWLINRVASRWRHLTGALVSTIAWAYISFTATRVADPSGGVTIVFGSEALATFAAFMAFVSVIGIFLGLLFWTEETGREISEDVPKSGGVLGGDD
jgi:hypothetical protein